MAGLWAWVNATDTGEDSLIAVLIPGAGFTPLVFAKERVARSALLRDIVKSHVSEHGYPARLVHYVEQGEIERVDFEP